MAERGSAATLYADKVRTVGHALLAGLVMYVGKVVWLKADTALVPHLVA
jgi:hypothetical protein